MLTSCRQICAELLANLSVEQAWPKLCETCRSQLQCSTIERDSHVTCTLSFEKVLIWCLWERELRHIYDDNIVPTKVGPFSHARTLQWSLQRLQRNGC